MQTTTLRPGFLVSLNTSIVGNVKYNKTDIETDHLTMHCGMCDHNWLSTGETICPECGSDEIEGSRYARWETARTIRDPEEHEKAVRVRSKIRQTITTICTEVGNHLLCPEAKREQLSEAIDTARDIANAFNAQGKVTNILVSVFVGRVISDDAEALRSLNLEMKQILAQMEEGVKTLNKESIQEAATAARRVGQMLSDDASEKVKAAVEAARSAAKNIAKASETAAREIDRVAMEAIATARSAFLDMDTFMNGTEIAPLTPPTSRVIDLEAIWAPKPPKLKGEALSAKLAEAI